MEKKETIINGFKGYDKNLKCRGFQYEIGKEYETDKKPVRCTENGFHFCENPLDVFNYYAPANSVFTIVEGSGDVSRGDEDTKIAVSKIKIGAEISLHSLIESGIKFIFERTKLVKSKINEKDGKQSSNSGNSGAASNSGDSGAALNSGYSGAALNSGNSGAASNSGYRGAALNSGDSGAASNSGNSGAASNSGYSGAASNSGDSGAASTTGSYSTAETSVENSFACALGYGSKAKGVLNSWLVLTEWEEDEGGNRLIKSVKAIKVDGKKILSNKWYQLKDGKPIVIE